MCIEDFISVLYRLRALGRSRVCMKTRGEKWSLEADIADQIGIRAAQTFTLHQLAGLRGRDKLNRQDLQLRSRREGQEPIFLEIGDDVSLRERWS